MAGFEHMGLGAASKSFAPEVPLLVLMGATEVIDVIWGVCAALGIEKMGAPAPWSHSLLMAVVWSFVFGSAAGFFYKKLRAGVVVGLLVFSHWVVDFITHPMTFILPVDTGAPLYPGSDSPLVGLGLYQTLPGMIAGFVVLVVPGVFLYWQFRRNGVSATHREVQQ